MIRDQDITIPRNDSRRVIATIEDVNSGPGGTDGPTDLIGKSLVWHVYRNSRDDDPVLELTDTDEQLVIDDANAGIVSLYLDSRQTDGTVRSGEHYLYVKEGTDQWTVTQGDFSITR